LVEECDDSSDRDWVVYGVEPGGLGESGRTPEDAHRNFREAFSDALVTFAKESQSFESFENHVKSFFHQIDDHDDRLWNAARAQVRAGVPLDSPFIEILPRETSEEPRRIEVCRLDCPQLDHHTVHVHPHPEHNRDDVVGLAYPDAA
jgi:predicted RNase H-like HicB family nuclease